MNMNISGLKFVMQIAGGGVSVAILVACYGLLYAPLRAQERQLEQRRIFIHKFVATRPEIVMQNRKLASQEQQLRRKVRRLEQRIPASSREHELLRELSRSAGETKTKLIDFQPGGYSKAGGWDVAVIRLAIRGTYVSICRFLEQCRTSQNLRRLAQINFRAADRSNGIFEVSLELHTLFNPETPDFKPETASRAKH